MANGLTGDLDAVVEVRVEAVNRILATLHQHGVSKDASPTLLHSFTARIGAAQKFPQYDLAAAFLVGLGANLDTVSESSAETRRILKAVDRVLQDTSSVLADASRFLEFETPTWLAVVRGTAAVQVSTPTVIFPQGVASEVSVRCQIRASYLPDPGTLPLPAPIHGEVRATFVFELHPSITPGKLMLEVELTDDDDKIAFLPAAGTSLTSAEAKQIAQQVRSFLRHKLEPIKHELPGDFPVQELKALGSGSTQVLALPLRNLPDSTVPSDPTSSIANMFLNGGDDFGVAIAKEYVNGVLAPLIAQLEAFTYTYTATGTIWAPFPIEITVSYHASVSSVAVSWQAGQIVLTVQGQATTTSILPNFTFTITRALTVKLDPVTQAFLIQTVGNLGVSGSLPAFARNIVREQVLALEGQALAGAQAELQQAIGTDTFGDALDEFDGSATTTFTALEITPDGLIVRGTLRASNRPDNAIVEIIPGPEGGVSGLRSWVPAGTVNKLTWSWVTAGPNWPMIPWDGINHELDDPHTFILPALQGAIHGQVCLAISGPQIGSTAGSVSLVSGGDTCSVGQPELVAAMPGWWDTLLLVPVWGPDPGPDQRLDERIVAHVNVVPESGPSGGASVNAVVHFAGDASVAPLQTIVSALSGGAGRDVALSGVVVLPEGSFGQMVQSIQGGSEEEPRAVEWEGGAPLAVTEDYEGEWTRVFQVERMPATYLLNARGEIAWRQLGPLDAASLRTALDEHAIPVQPPLFRFQHVGVRIGDRAPDFLFEYASGRQVSLRTLRGRRVVVAFWKSWSSPCLRELRYLQRLHDAADRRETVILAVGDGVNAQQAAEYGRQHGLTLILVPDPDRRITHQYRVSCWPTTVSIGGDGLIDRIHYGQTPER